MQKVLVVEIFGKLSLSLRFQRNFIIWAKRALIGQPMTVAPDMRAAHV